MKKVCLPVVLLLVLFIGALPPSVYPAPLSQQEDPPLPSKATTDPQPLLIPDGLSIDAPLDIVYVQDETGSMGNDIAALRALAPQIWDSIEAITTSEFRMSVVGFRDYAKYPWGNSGDHVYRLVGEFTSDRAQFVAAVNQLTAANGEDVPEGYYPALAYLLSPGHPCIDSDRDGSCLDPFDTPVGRQPSFRSGARRVILLATDANAHEPSDTSAYPGPSQDSVVEALNNNRAVVIGLVPGGPGAVVDTDDLAAATGGSVQSTGSSGDQVAAAIIAALGEIRPISPDLSTVEVTPATAPANGTSLVTVRITVKDTAGNPVEGRQVILRTTRPSADILAQPALLTDESGRTQGYLSSVLAGSSQVIAADAIDSVTFTAQPVVQFTAVSNPPGTELAKKIELLNKVTTDSNDRIGLITEQAGESGERLREAITEDSVEMAANVAFGFAGYLGDLKDAVKPAFAIKYSGLTIEEGIGWSRITWLKQFSFTSGALFNSAFRDALIRGETSDLALATLFDGIPFYAAMLEDEVVEKLSTGAVEKAFERLVGQEGGLREAAQFASDAAENNNRALTQQTNEVLANIPPMSEAQQLQYADELQGRMTVPIIYDNLLWRQQFLIDNLEGARNSLRTSGLDLFLLKFSAQFLATAMFDGVGSTLVNGYTTTLDTYISGRKLDASSRAFSAVPALMMSSSDYLQRLYANQASGLDRISNALPPNRVDGRITSVTQVSLGDSWADFWKEDQSYSNVTIVNDSDERALFQVITQYDYQDTLLGLPFARIPINDIQTVELNAGQSHTFRVNYKDEERGGTPIEDSLITFVLLAVNETGTFAADYDSIIWNPTTLSRSRGNQPVVLAADTQVIENPIAMYVLGGEGEARYETKVMIANPYTEAITSVISLPLPSGAVVQETDGTVVGDTIEWEKTISASDIAVGRVVLEYPSAKPGDLLQLPAADMTFAEPVTGVVRSTASNTAEFEGAWPLDVQAAIPAVETGTAGVIPVTILSLIDASQTTTLRLRLIQDSDVVHQETRTLTVGGGEERTTSFTLPAGLNPGWYSIELWATAEGRERVFAAHNLRVAEVTSQTLFLPVSLQIPYVPPTLPLLNGNFEAGPANWTQSSSHNWPMIVNSDQVEGLPTHSGIWIAWLGGDDDETSTIEQTVTVPPDRPFLTYYHGIASEDACGYDFGRVLVDGAVVEQYTLCRNNNTPDWAYRVVDLSAYAGRTVALQFRATTDGSLNSNLLIDDVAFNSATTVRAAPVPFRWPAGITR